MPFRATIAVRKSKETKRQERKGKERKGKTADFRQTKD